MAEATVMSGGVFDSMAERIVTLDGWRRWLAAAVCGALTSLALPPIYVVPALIPAFCGFYWLCLGARNKKQAFATGWCFGFLHFTSGLYWITNALLVDAEKFGWLAPFAVSGLSVGFAIFTGLVALGFHLGQRRGFATGLAGPLLFALVWTAGEWLRGHVLTGFPWNLMATVWLFAPAMSQAAALFGAYGLSFVTVLAAVAPAALFAHGAPSARRPVLGVALLIGVLVLCGIGGAVRLALAPATADQATVPGVRLRLVQANIDQRMKWSEAERANILRKYLTLSRQPGAAPVTHLVWPETALPYLLSNDPELLHVLGQIVPRGGLLLTGAVRAEIANGRMTEVWNSVQAVDDGGRITATYDKVHLVPFGEYVPLRRILPLDKITPGGMDFTAGNGPQTLTLPGLPPVSPFICYEAIFPGVLVSGGAPRPQWLLNVTNDAWFGDSTGPRQHFASARLRAIEEGLPLVRAANTGISAVVDPYGRILAQLNLGREGVLDSPLPTAVPATLYARLGDGMLAGLLAVAFGLIVVLRRPS